MSPMSVAPANHEPILHHYPASPFSEKIRLILGLKNLTWHSVTVPAILPKPDVIALTGGYRRTPVLQIGADIYCDTELIARRLDRIAPAPPLYPAALAATATAMAQWADSVLFSAAVAVVFEPSLIEKMRAKSPADAQAFIDDRAAMRKGTTTRRVPLAEAHATLAVFLRALDDQCADGRGWLLGDVPTIADFATFHPLWFLAHNPRHKDALAPYRHVDAWAQRMRALGHGRPRELTSAAALDVAGHATPVPLAATAPAEKFQPGDAISVAPTDYGLDPVAGELVALTNEEIAVRRSDTRAGTLVVHFPRFAYDIRRAEA